MRSTCLPDCQAHAAVRRRAEVGEPTVGGPGQAPEEGVDVLVQEQGVLAPTCMFKTIMLSNSFVVQRKSHPPVVRRARALARHPCPIRSGWKRELIRLTCCSSSTRASATALRPRGGEGPSGCHAWSRAWPSRGHACASTGCTCTRSGCLVVVCTQQHECQEH